MSEQTTGASRPGIRSTFARQEKASLGRYDPIQREDVLDQLGPDADAGGPFKSRNYAAAVAAKEVRNVTS